MSRADGVGGGPACVRPGLCRRLRRVDASVNPRGPRRRRPATVASATRLAQISTDSATCATTAHGLSRVITLAAPDRIWATNSRNATVDKRTSDLERSVAVLARTIVHRTNENPARASTRCVNIAIAPSASKDGISLPSMSGQSVKTSWALLARTNVPTSSSAPTHRGRDQGEPREPRPGPMTAQRPTEPAGSRGSQIGHVGDQGERHDEVRGDPPRVEVRRDDDAAEDRLTQHQGERRARRRHRMRGSRRWDRIATMPHSAVSTITMNANARWENSIREWIVPEGKSCPGSHWGHVEHPSPEPLPRTKPPTLNSATVVTAVATASFWKRVMEVMEGSPS